MATFETKKQLELAAGAAAVLAGAAAVAAVTYYRMRPLHDSTILENPKLTDDKRVRLNLVAAYVLLGTYVERNDVVDALGITKHHASQSLSYLKESDLIMRARTVFADGSVVRHYQATETLATAASEDGLKHFDLVDSIDRLVFGETFSENS